MKCFKCAAQLEEGARFCGACGAQQPGAVVPQAAVRTGAKTIFQGAGPVGAAPPSRPVAQPPQPQPAPAAPDPKSQLGLAATMAPTALPEEVRAAIARGAGAAEVPGDLTGQTLNNRYMVEKKIGEGGFGAVYRARQTGMNRVVALKVLHPRMAKDPQVVGRFKREAQASSLLRAPHTVQVYDFDQTPEGVMYLSMEMLEGKSLHQTLKDDKFIEARRLAKILDGIADSLGEAHAQGIVHRDIKPENIFLEPRPTPDFVKVLDFGIAKIVKGDGLGTQGPALTAAGQTLGTLEYMSPEQLMGAQLDGRSDLYAMGIMAYEMLTGALPFKSRTPGEMITAHLKTMPPPPSQAAPDRGIPPAMDAIVLKLVEKNRDKRYRDTAELRAELARVMAGDTSAPVRAQPAAMAIRNTAPPQQPLGVTPRPAAQATPIVEVTEVVGSSRRLAPGLVVGLVAIVTAIVVALGGLLWWSRR